MKLRLTVIAGPDAGRTFELDSGQNLLVGRGDKSDLKLGDPSVSRIHFQISNDDGTVKVADQGSSSGLFVDGKKVDESGVEIGNVVQAGDTRMRVDRFGEPEKTVAPTARAGNIETKPLFQLVGTELGPYKLTDIIGKGKSDMDKIVERIARFQDRVVVGDQFPDRGSYYRSDQFSLAKVGVPGVYLSSGVHVIGKPDGWGKEQMRKWTEEIYHQTSDEYSDDWNLDGAVQDAKLLFYVGLQAANQEALPAWSEGDEFEAARMSALKAIK